MIGTIQSANFFLHKGLLICFTYSCEMSFKFLKKEMKILREACFCVLILTLLFHLKNG